MPYDCMTCGVCCKDFDPTKGTGPILTDAEVSALPDSYKEQVVTTPSGHSYLRAVDGVCVAFDQASVNAGNGGCSLHVAGKPSACSTMVTGDVSCEAARTRFGVI